MPARLRLLRGISPADPLPISAVKALRENAICLKRDHQTSVWLVHVQGRDLVVKQWRTARPKRRLQALFRRTPAFTHWRAARRLERAAIPTARCIAIARGRRDDSPCEWLVMDHIQGQTVLRHLAERNLSPRQEHRLAEAVGSQIAQLAIACRGNRDHKPSNLIVQGEISEHEPPAIAVIDCVGVGRGARREWMAKALLAECLGTATLPRRTILLRCALAMATDPMNDRASRADARQRARAIWHNTKRALVRHGDPTPRVNPLDQSHAPRATDRCSEQSVP